MNDKPLISVIVPVYNVEGYLDACMHSIVNQTYTNLEIIVVDDGSTDSSGTLCDRWAGKDERVSVIHQPNGGLSAARNTALDAMHGQLVMMVDSDDVLHPHAIDTLLDIMQQHQADIAVGGYIPFYGSEPQWPTAQHSMHRRYSRDEAIMAVFYQQRLTHSAWGRIYKADLFHGLRYPVGIYYEDIAIIYPLLLKASLVVSTSVPLYGYRQRQNSILEKFSPGRAAILDTCEALERQLLMQGHTAHLKAVRSRLLSAYFNIMLLSRQDRSHDHSALQDRCWNGIKRLRHECLIDPHVRRKNKLGILASFGGRWFLCHIVGRNYHPKP